MAEPVDMIFPLLREMRAEIAAKFADNDAAHRLTQTRLDKMEVLGSFRHALTADSLLSKLVTGEFEERIDILERKVRELEGQK